SASLSATFRVCLFAPSRRPSVSHMARDGIRLDDATVRKMADEQTRRDRWTRAGVWVGAGALVALLIAQLV
ncbi:MAG: hypothetical protein ACR2O4_14630, partial [Hyphomicrobiaceae bacterium]